MKRTVTIYTEADDIGIIITGIRRQGANLMLETKALGELDMEMVCTPSELFKGIIMALSWEVVLFILLLPYFGLKQLLRAPKTKGSGQV